MWAGYAGLYGTGLNIHRSPYAGRVFEYYSEDGILTGLIGTAWTQGVQYNYNDATGLFTTVPGQILVPAATYTQDPVTGAYTMTPGIATLVVTGTI